MASSRCRTLRALFRIERFYRTADHQRPDNKLVGTVNAFVVRGGVEHNYRMILVSDAVAEISREAHKIELQTMDRLFADLKSTDEVIGWVGRR